jgi:hypothetical protein
LALQRTYVKHWAARILGFIVLPLSVYLLSFKLHFLILRNSGTGDSQMSSLFQANLNGNDFAQNPLGASLPDHQEASCPRADPPFSAALLPRALQRPPTTQK